MSLFIKQGLIVDDLSAKRESVYEHRWYGMFPPTEEELKNAYDVGEAERISNES